MRNARRARLRAPQAGFAGDVARVAAVTALVLLAPMVAMQFTRDVAWTAFDFALGAALLFGAGLACLRAARRFASGRRHALLLALPALACLAIWAELAVGIGFGLGS